MVIGLRVYRDGSSVGNVGGIWNISLFATYDIRGIGNSMEYTYIYFIWMFHGGNIIYYIYILCGEYSSFCIMGANKI